MLLEQRGACFTWFDLQVYNCWSVQKRNYFMGCTISLVLGAGLGVGL